MNRSLISLVRSMSSAEKRAFRLHCKRQSGSRTFIRLYEIIQSTQPPDADRIVRTFQAEFPKSSTATTGQYLMQLITDTLVMQKIKRDTSFQAQFNMMRARILFERSLPDDALKEIRKIRASTEANDLYQLYYMATREELNYRTQNQEVLLSEKQLISMQSSAKNALDATRQIHEHYSLYELLTHRLNRVKWDQKQVHDLILTELSLVTRRGNRSFASQKLHLLFQSFFFTHTRDHKSALRTFESLIHLFETHMQYWGNPPYDYLSTLEGILYNLKTLGKYQEMEIYIAKVRNLQGSYGSEHFATSCQQIIVLNILQLHLADQAYGRALDTIAAMEAGILKKHGISDYTRYVQIQFYVGLTKYHLDRWSDAKKHLAEVELTPGVHEEMLKAACLITMIIDYQLHNFNYLEQTIRAYKRTARKKGRLLLTEKWLMNTILFDPDRKSKPQRHLFRKRMMSKMQEKELDRKEQQLLDYFPFHTWMAGKLS